jgi:hypothetical protein
MGTKTFRFRQQSINLKMFIIMKNIIKLFVFLTFFSNCKAQNQPILRTVPMEETYSDDFDLKSGDYIKDTGNSLNKFIGTWQYNNGNGTILTLKLQIKNQVIFVSRNGNYRYYDMIISTYKLVKNGVTFIDNVNLTIPTSFTNLGVESMKYGKFDYGGTIDKISGKITDLTLGIITSAELEYIITGVNTPPQIKLKMYGNDSRRLHPDSFYEGKPTFEIPNFKVLTKID